MIRMGCDFHTRYQQIGMAREETRELLVERRLDNESREAHAFYRSLQYSQESVCVSIEAAGLISMPSFRAEDADAFFLVLGGRMPQPSRFFAVRIVRNPVYSRSGGVTLAIQES